MGNLQVVEVEWNTGGRKIYSRRLRTNGTQWGYLANRHLPDLLLFITLNLSESKHPKISFLKQVSLNLLGKKGGRGNFFLSLLVF